MLKSGGFWLPKGGKQSGKDGITECTEPLTLDRLAAMLAIGSLVLIGVMSAALGILWHSPKKAVSLKPDAAELNAQHTQQGAVGIESKSAPLDPPVRGTPGWSSLLPTQSVLIKALPGSPYQPPLTRKPALRRFGTESDGRGWRFRHRLSALAQKRGSAGNSTRKWPKAFIMYLEAHRDYLRKILRHSETAALNARD